MDNPMTATWLTSLLLFTLVATLSPGPNNLMVTASGAAFGYRRTLPHMFGITFGFVVMATVIAAGLGALFERWLWLHRTLQIAGAAYLVFLAWKIWRAGRVNLSADTEQPAGRPLTFLQAAAFQWLNPKAWTMAITALAAFTLPPPYHVVSAGAVIGAYFLMCVPCISLWILLGQMLVKWLQSEKARQAFNTSLAVLTVSSVALIFI